MRAPIKQWFPALKRELNKMGVRDAKITPFPALAPATLDALERKHELRLPQELRAYYSAVNGQHISWSLPGTSVMGWSIVSDLVSFLSGRVTGYVDGANRTDAPFYSKYLDVESKRSLDDHFVFERTYADTFILIPRKTTDEPLSLFLFEYPHRLTRLNLSFSEYIDHLFSNRALLNWQQQYKASDRDPELLADLEAATQLIAGEKPPKPIAVQSVELSYQKRLDDLAKRIRANKRLELVRLDRYPLPPRNAFKKIESTFRSPLPKAMLDFYSHLNGFRLVWQTKPVVTPAASGVLDLFPLERAFGGEHHMWTVDWDEFVTRGELWNDESKDICPADSLTLRNMRQFDRHLGRNQILMEVVNSGVDFFSYIDGGTSKLNAGFDEVLDMVFQTAGVEYYPELFGQPDKKLLASLYEKIRLVNPEFRLPINGSEN